MRKPKDSDEKINYESFTELSFKFGPFPYMETRIPNMTYSILQYQKYENKHRYAMKFCQ